MNQFDYSNNGGLDKQFIDDLPTHNFKKKVNQMNEDEPQCTICMTAFEENEKVKTLLCFHQYHI